MAQFSPRLGTAGAAQRPKWLGQQKPAWCARRATWKVTVPARGWRRDRGWRLGWRGTARSGGGAPVEMGGCARQGLSVGGSPTRPGVDGVAGKRWHGGVPRCSGAPTVTGGRVNSYSMVRGRGGEGGWLNFGEGP
jgi:hypothetical protein